MTVRIDLVFQMRAHVFLDLRRQIVAPVVHREYDALQFDLRVNSCTDRLDGAHDLAEAFEREKLALQRNDHRIRSGERIDGEKAQRGRAIDQDIARLDADGGLAEFLNGVGEPVMAALGVDQFDFRAGEIDAGGGEQQPRNIGFRHRRFEAVFPAKNVISGDAAVRRRNPKTGRGVALRVEIDEQDFFAHRGERGREIDRGRGFADAAFLVGDGENPRLERTMRC